MCVSSVPIVDDPNTAIDESNVQVNLTVPSTLSLKLIRPVANSIASLTLARWRTNSGDITSFREIASVPRQSRSHSIQRLLCTFLI